LGGRDGKMGVRKVKRKSDWYGMAYDGLVALCRSI
jgi:hypothetical protein